MNNKKAEAVAYLQLGKVCTSERNYQKGNASFAKALEVTKETEDENGYNAAKCGYAYTNAHLNLQEHFNGILKNINKMNE